MQLPAKLAINQGSTGEYIVPAIFLKWKAIISIFIVLSFTLVDPPALWAGEGEARHALPSGISISILAATVLEYLGTLIRQPLDLGVYRRKSGHWPEYRFRSEGRS